MALMKYGFGRKGVVECGWKGGEGTLGVDVVEMLVGLWVVEPVLR